MKYLVPLARANRSQCEQLVTGLSDTRVSVRELGALYDAWRRADRAGKQRIVAEPLLCLRARSQTRAPDADEPSSLRKDLSALAAIAWRAARRVRAGELSTDHTRAWRTTSDASLRTRR